MKQVIRFFDKLEDRIRGALSHYPIIYALIGAIGIVLVWKGIWEWAETVPFLFGPVSIVLGVLILLASGLMVSFFIGDGVIISGLKHEKKLFEKTETEVRDEEKKVDAALSELHKIEKEVEQIETELHEKAN